MNTRRNRTSSKYIGYVLSIFFILFFRYDYLNILLGSIFVLRLVLDELYVVDCYHHQLQTTYCYNNRPSLIFYNMNIFYIRYDYDVGSNGSNGSNGNYAPTRSYTYYEL